MGNKPSSSIRNTLGELTTNNGLPKTMMAAVATGFGEVDENIFLQEDWPVPKFDSTGRKAKKAQDMLIRVLAVALAPGDPRVLSGACDWIQLPKGGHPYIIGSDVAGIVVEVSPYEKKFQVGDYVASRFELPGPHDSAAEYRIVHTKLSEKCPPCIPPVIACGLPASAAVARTIVKENMKQNDRALVIGGSGGVGSSVIQYAKLYGASFVAAVSTHKDLCEKLGADRVIDYREENWWEVKDFQAEPKKFDIVFDMVNGDNWTVGGHSNTVLRPRQSIYFALVPGVAVPIELHSLWDLLKLSVVWSTQSLIASPNRKLPKSVFGQVLDKLTENDLRELFEDVAEGRFKPVVDPASPFPFTQEGVRDAMKLQKSCHAEGKVVIEIAKQ